MTPVDKGLTSDALLDPKMSWCRSAEDCVVRRLRIQETANMNQGNKSASNSKEIELFERALVRSDDSGWWSRSQMWRVEIDIYRWKE